MKKIILLAIFALIFSNTVFAKDIPVKIKPMQKITTSDLNLIEGDKVEFATSEDVFVNSKLYIKKGQKISGCITSIVPNGFLVEPATIYIENFRTIDVNKNSVKFKGIIYKSGNDHDEITEFFMSNFLRGGEVQIKPKKDEFTIYVEERL